MWTSVCRLVYPPFPVSGYTCSPKCDRECAPEKQVAGVASPGGAAATPGMTTSAVSVSPDAATARTTRPFMIDLLGCIAVWNHPTGGIALRSRSGLGERERRCGVNHDGLDPLLARGV